MSKKAVGYYLKPSTAALYMDMGYKGVMQLVKEKKIKAKRLENGEWRLFRDSIDKFMATPSKEDRDIQLALARLEGI